jgi:hypothetical protein
VDSVLHQQLEDLVLLGVAQLQRLRFLEHPLKERSEHSALRSALNHPTLRDHWVSQFLPRELAYLGNRKRPLLHTGYRLWRLSWQLRLHLVL